MMISITHVRNGLVALMFAAAFLFAFAFALPAHAATSIANPGLEASTTVSTLPDNWTTGGFGVSTTTFNYAGVAGHSGKGVNVTITNYTSGDAKWIFDPVDIEAGGQYTFSDWYKSTVPTRIVAALYKTGETDPSLYIQVASLSATSTWAQTTQTITPNLGYAKMTVYHLIEGNGTLTTDDYTLAQTASSADNLFPQGLVSLTFDDGWQSQVNNALPALTAANLKATFYIIGTALTQAAANPADGYFTPAAMLDLQSKGHEIGGHTQNHCNLVFLQTGHNGTGQVTDSNDPNTCAYPTAGRTYSNEISDGYTTVTSAGGTQTTFAYPNGATNSVIKSFIGASTAYKAARTVDEGYNTRKSDIFGLKVEVVDNNADFTKVKGWIDTAIANKLWLILVFHQIDNPVALASNGETGGTTPENFTQIVHYLASSTPAGTVLPMRDVLPLMGVTITPVDTTAPVIASHADVPATATSTTSVGANVTYTNPTANDAKDGNVSASVLCAPASGAFFSIGTTTVNCSAHDAANNQASSTFKVVVSAAPVVVVTTPVPVAITPASGALTAGTVGTAYNQSFTASTSATGTFTWSLISGSLPAGLSLSTTTGLTATVSGTPTATSSSSFTLRVTNGTASTTGAYTLLVNAAAPTDPTCDTATQHLENHLCVNNPVTQPTGGGSSPSGPGGGGGIVGTGPLSIGYVNTNTPGLSLPGAVLGVSTNCYAFTKTLQVGSTGADVSALQNRLTLEGLFSANQTGYFGSITKTAVMAFQAKNGVESVGIVGPKTRAILNGTCPIGATGAANQPAPSIPSGANFTQTLSVGSIGAEVTLLQKVLIDLTFLKIASPTGYFGSITKAAVMGYQTSRSIPATGLVGPLTRAALNSNAGATH